MGIKERVKVSANCFFLGGMGREGFGERREGLQGEEGGGGGGGGVGQDKVGGEAAGDGEGLLPTYRQLLRGSSSFEYSHPDENEECYPVSVELFP